RRCPAPAGALLTHLHQVPLTVAGRDIDVRHRARGGAAPPPSGTRAQPSGKDLEARAPPSACRAHGSGTDSKQGWFARCDADASSSRPALIAASALEAGRSSRVTLAPSPIRSTRSGAAGTTRCPARAPAGTTPTADPR